MSESLNPAGYSGSDVPSHRPYRWAATVAANPERYGIMLLRLAIGVVFLMHGGQKWFVYGPGGTAAAFGKMGIPAIGAYTAMTAELVCGALLVIGLFTRFAAVPLIVVMLVALITVHGRNGFFLPTGYEFVLSLLGGLLALLLAGPGTLAIDDVIAGDPVT
ncbi:MAG: DoxX family protein [Phycisphaerales bacterium]|nr:DoxX family protein [Phycisphaerales bacterium]